MTWCDALRGCLAVKFDSCNSLLSSIHTLLVNILRYVRLLYINRKYKNCINLHYTGQSSHFGSYGGNSYSTSKRLFPSSAPSSGDLSTRESTRDNGIKVVLENRDLWQKFDSIGTEMIITKSGRYTIKTLKKLRVKDPHMFIHWFMQEIYKAPLQEIYSEAPRTQGTELSNHTPHTVIHTCTCMPSCMQRDIHIYNFTCIHNHKRIHSYIYANMHTRRGAI